jgi:hypothetical protein
MKILSFLLFFWVIFALLDPDPDPAAQINADPCGSGYGSGSETLILDVSQRLFFILLSMKQCPIFVSKQFHISLLFLGLFEYVSNAISNYVQNF